MNILIAGDFCPQNRVAELFENDEFSKVLGEVKPVAESSDYAIVNLECPIIRGKEKPIVKCGANLCCSDRVVSAVKWAGFDCLTLANNHFRDFGDEGVNNTLSECKKNDIDTVGGGPSILEASKSLIKQLNGKTIAIINCCENEFSIATETKGGSNPLNTIKQYYAIKEAKRMADFVLVIVHGGHELWQLPSPRMKETYHFFIDAGADAVVNHHQHCYSGYEVYKEKPIFYGLGNFCFDKGEKKNDIWELGYMVMLHIGKDISFDTIPYRQCGASPVVNILSEKDKSLFKTNIEKINCVIADDKKLQQEFSDYLSKKSSDFRFVVTPYRKKILTSLFNKGLLPSFFPRENYLLLREMFTCESHYDTFLYYINKQIEKI